MDPTIAAYKVTGLCAATFTAFHEDGSLNLDAIPAQLAELKRGGVGYVFVGGTTGEGFSLSNDERKALTAAWVAQAGTEVDVIAHVGCESLTDTKELAAHAASVGVKAISVMSSVFFKPSSIAVLVKWLEAVAESAPSTPLYYYHIAIMTGVNFRMDKLLEAVHGKIPSFRGIKYSDMDLHIYANCVAYKDGLYDVLYGKDEQLLGALAMGGTGAVGSTYNYMGATYVRLIAAFKAGDLAAALVEQRRSQLGVDVLINGKYGDGANVGKAILAAKGLPMGPPRLPRLPMSPAATATLAADLEAIGFFEWSY